jgi:hypothetical protein
MLHHADATWLDEDYGPIHVRNRRAWVAQLEAERAAGAEERARESYEAMPIARLTRRILGSLVEIARRVSRGPHER